MALILKSSAFGHGAEIPARYTCKSDDVSPPLNWEGVPEDARSLVLRHIIAQAELIGTYQK